MVPPLKILHIASFSGNIGDNANHMGFRPWFEALAGAPVSWTRLEIREFYWRERQWDAALVDFINTHDLLVIGGGNYFELWVEGFADRNVDRHRARTFRPDPRPGLLQRARRRSGTGRAG